MLTPSSRGVRRALAAAVSACAATAQCGSLAGASTSSSRALAHSARTLTANDNAHLHPVRGPGSEILEEGNATGTLPGNVRAYINVGSPVRVKFTISGHGWSITGEGSGELKGRSKEPSFAGHMTVISGTGRYRHAHGHGGFYGTLNRENERAVVQTRGTISY